MINFFVFKESDLFHIPSCTDSPGHMKSGAVCWSCADFRGGMLPVSEERPKPQCPNISR